MRRFLWILSLVSLAVWGMAGCKPGLLPTEDAGKPKVTLERIEVAGAFPWADPPARNPLALAFVFNIENPSGYNIMLDNIKFAYSFEVNPDYYIEMNVPVAYDRLYFPPKTTSQYRIVNILDSAVITGKLMVTQGAKLQALELKPIDLIKNCMPRSGILPLGLKWEKEWQSLTLRKGMSSFPLREDFPRSNPN